MDFISVIEFANKLELNESRRKKNLLYQVMLDYAYGKGHSETEFFNYNTIANAKGIVASCSFHHQFLHIAKLLIATHDDTITRI